MEKDVNRILKELRQRKENIDIAIRIIESEMQNKNNRRRPGRPRTRTANLQPEKD